MENPVLRSSCVTPAGTSIEVQNEWEENTHTHTHDKAGLRGYVQFNKYTHTHTMTPKQFVQRKVFVLYLVLDSRRRGKREEASELAPDSA